MRGFAVALVALSLVAGPVFATDTAGTAPAATQDAMKGAKTAPTKKPGHKRRGRQHQASAKPAAKPEAAEK